MFLVKEWKEVQLTVPSFEQTLAQLEAQGGPAIGDYSPTGLHPMDVAAATTMGIPVLGDIVGLAADARMYAQEPESRTPLNYALSGLGMLPFVPSAAAIMRGAKGAAKVGEEVKLSQAQKMFDEGYSPADIWDETGWYQGVDEQWRSEIPDFSSKIDVEKMKVQPQKPGFIKSTLQSAVGSNIGVNKLQDILQHPEFFRNYPEFNPTVVTYYDPRNKVYGGFDDENQELYVNLSWHYDQAKDLVDDVKSPEFQQALNDEIKATLLHEVQHGVQNIEDFAKGGLNDDPFYKRLAGEVESRMVEKRSRVPESKLPKIRPIDIGQYGSMDVPFEEQISNLESTMVHE